MKMDVINDGSCDQRLTCFYEECCNQENLNHEFFMIHLVIYSILIIYSLVCSYKMREYCKPNLKDKEYFSDKTSDFHLFNIFSSPLIKYSIFYLIISKCFIIYFSKYFLNFGDLRYYSTPSYDQSSFIEDSFMIEVTQGWVLQLSLLIISYNLIQLSGDFLEFYKKNVILISIYLIILSANVKTYFNREILIYQTYGFLSIICLLISILTIFLTIIGNRVFFSRLNREDTISEINLNKIILEEYSKTLPENDRGLYRETNRVFDMYKVFEIIQKIRLNRKQVWMIGLLFVFLIGFLSILFNIYQFSRNFKLSYYYQESFFKNNDFLEMNNFDYLYDKNVLELKQQIMRDRLSKQQFPYNMILVVVSQLEFESMEINQDFKEFINYLTKEEKSGRVYKLHNQNDNQASSWVSYFTGANIELTGVKGNIMNIPQISSFDNIFKRMKKNRVSNSIICKKRVKLASPSMDMFLRSRDANILNEELDDKVSKLERRNTLEYSDEKRFQDILRVIKNQKLEYKTLINRNNTYEGNKIMSDEYHVNQFMMVHFSELLQMKSNNIHEDYHEALSNKAQYLRKIYETMNNETIFLMVSDSSNSMKTVPFIVAKKNSNFSSVEYSLYSSKYKPIFNQVDIAPTISALLNIEIPRQSQGKIIDEIIEIIKPSEKERKLIYLDFRQQQQRFISNILRKFNQNVTKLGIKYRPPNIATPEYYYNEISSFREDLKTFKSDFISAEKSRNYFISLVVSLIIAFISITLVEYLTFTNMLNIYSFQESGCANRNCMLKAIFSIAVYYFSIYIILNLYYNDYKIALKHGEFSNVRFLCEVLTLFLIFPILLTNFIFRLLSSFFFYANYVENPVKTKSFLFKNFFSDIDYVVFSENGVANLYLFRIYNIVVSVICSLILLFYYNKYSFMFSNEENIVMLVYQGDNVERLRFINYILWLQIVYLFISLSCFYQYPQFSKIKQIFDSLFLLYDQKVIDTLESELFLDEESQKNKGTNEKDALKSNFAKLLINFDPQSEMFYRFRHVNFDLVGITEKISVTIILYQILNSKYNLGKLENIKLEDIMVARETSFVNEMRRTTFVKR